MWCKLDDRLPTHPKTLEAGRLIGANGQLVALGYFMTAVNYSNQHLTDGCLSWAAIDALPGDNPRALARVMCTVSLFECVPAGYVIHHFHDHNPYAADVIFRRECDRIKKANKAREKAKIDPLPYPREVTETDRQERVNAFKALPEPAEIPQTFREKSSRKSRRNGTRKSGELSASGADFPQTFREESSSRARAGACDPNPNPNPSTTEKNGAADAARLAHPVENSDGEPSSQDDEVTDEDLPPLPPDKPTRRDVRKLEALIRREHVSLQGDLADVSEGVKQLAARFGLPYDSSTVAAAIESMRFKRQTGLSRSP